MNNNNLINNNDYVFYIFKDDGQKIGPFSTSIQAEQKLMIEGINGRVVPCTSTGNQILLG